MSDRFSAKKQQILSALSRPKKDYTDASPKGSVDDGVRELIRLINATPGFVTTSSCAGRVAVYLEGPPKQASSAYDSVQNGATSSLALEGPSTTSAGGKGGGRWLFSSHYPINLDAVASEGALFRLLGFPSSSEVAFPSANSRPQFVHLKFEPMILHILTFSPEEAHTALNAAVQAGFRESGISSIIDNKGRPSNPLVAVRTSGLALDSIIGFQDPNSTTGTRPIIHPMVPEPYLRTVVQLANDRFATNEERKARFGNLLCYEIGPDMLSANGGPSKGGFESRAARKERKRQEGLQRRQEMLLIGGALDGSERLSENQSTEDDDYGIGSLVEGDVDAEEPKDSLDLGSYEAEREHALPVPGNRVIETTGMQHAPDEESTVGGM